MNLLFISTHNLATNPRLYKEIALAADQGHRVEVICFEFKNWSYGYNLQLLKSLEPCVFHIIPANRDPFLPWLKSVVEENLYRKLDAVIPLKTGALAKALNRRNSLIIKEINKIKGPFDWVVGHNPGALYATKYAARKFRCRWGFDVEDYHPGESNNPGINQRVIRYLKEHLPEADYLTFASPLIKKETEKSVGLSSKDEYKTILNYFPSSEFIKPKAATNDEPLKLVWFSQKISFGRGLEEIIPVVEQTEEIHLYLIGDINDDFYEEILKGRKNISILEPLPQANLHGDLSQYDAGLAIEPGKDKNNELALSNKILAYQQAGLFILATGTPAQSNFLSQHSGIGIITTLDAVCLKNTLSGLVGKKAEIRKERANRFLKAKSFCWEEESRKLLTLWNMK